MQMKRTVLVLLSFALALGAAVAAQRPPAWAPQADAIFADVADPGAAGCAMAVYRDGRIAYERGYGIADLEHDVPITPASVFYVGSLSKSRRSEPRRSSPPCSSPARSSRASR